jgi:hypothetical protein
MASRTMEELIFETPASRSRNTIGTSTMGSPRSNTRSANSIWNE